MCNIAAELHVLSDHAFDNSHFGATIFAGDFDYNVAFISDKDVAYYVSTRVDFDRVCSIGVIVIIVNNKSFKARNRAASTVCIAEYVEGCAVFFIATTDQEVSATAAIKRGFATTCLERFILIATEEDISARAADQAGNAIEDRN